MTSALLRVGLTHSDRGHFLSGEGSIVRGPVSFVGRQLESESLAARFEEAASGTPMLALISGDAGMGKTRLMRESPRSFEKTGSVIWGRSLGGAAEQTVPAAVLTPCATATPTARPTAAPTAHAALMGVTFGSVQGGSPGSDAAVSVLTAAEALCSISCVDPAGTNSSAQRLAGQRASRTGAASWSWKTDGNASPGTGLVTVTCNGASATTSIPIG